MLCVSNRDAGFWSALFNYGTCVIFVILLPGTQNTTGSNVRGTTMRSGSFVATIDWKLSMLVVLYCEAATLVQFRHG